MHLGRVIGTVVPAVVVEGLAGVPLLWVQPLDKHGAARGRTLVCADGTRMAGPGETIYWVASREAALTLDPWFVPVDHAVVGIVDDVQIDPDATTETATGAPSRDRKTDGRRATGSRRASGKTRSGGDRR